MWAVNLETILTSWWDTKVKLLPARRKKKKKHEKEESRRLVLLTFYNVVVLTWPGPSFMKPFLFLWGTMSTVDCKRPDYKI